MGTVRFSLIMGITLVITSVVAILGCSGFFSVFAQEIPANNDATDAEGLLVNIPVSGSTGNATTWWPVEGEPVEGEGEPDPCNPDVTPPVITLAGEDEVLLEDCIAYKEEGLASVIDLCDGDLGTVLLPEDMGVRIWVSAEQIYVNSTLSDIEDDFNTPYSETSGEYVLVYSVIDSAGNEGVADRTISVTCEPVEVEGEPDEEITILLPGGVPLVLVYIPAGTFLMGRYSGEQDSLAEEDPQHSVTLSQDFYMGKYELTQQQWLAVMGSWPGRAPSALYGVGDTYPAYFVSWDDAQNFIAALNTHIANTSQGPATVRLPSEAEWEYACRAGTTTRFYWGDDLSLLEIGDYAWWDRNNSPYGSKPVGGKLPNAFGLYDMIGSLWEWCEDDWHDNYTGAPVNGSAWVDAPRGSLRALRGGFWNSWVLDCRSASRLGTFADSRTSLGFRVSRTP